MKKLNFLILFLVAQLVYGQDAAVIIAGQVLDANDVPLSYVNIGIVGSTVGTVSDERGNFKLYRSSKTTPGKRDTLRFSIIGYEDRNFDWQALIAKNEPMKVRLKERSFDLGEVLVRPAFEHRKTKGKKKVKTKRRVNFAISSKPRQNLGTEIAKKIKVKKKTTQIEEVKFYIAQNNFDTVRFRIQIYNVKKGKPHEHISNQDIVMEVSGQQKGWVSFDLKPYSIYTKKDFIISLQWIDHSDKGRVLSMPIIVPSFGGNHYYKFGSQNKWKRFRNMSSSIQVTVA